jgi:hypothetical protein
LLAGEEEHPMTETLARFGHQVLVVTMGVMTLDIFLLR